jgi:chemotaxis signal transduction protein
VSAARFKSSSDYFKSRSGLTKQVITKQSNTKKQSSPRASDLSVPLDLFMDVFCADIARFTVDNSIPQTDTGDDLESAVAAHLAGESMVAVDPCADDNTTRWHVIRFERTETLQQPFGAARTVVGELDSHGIASLVEVGAGGKGHYNIWLFHESSVPCAPVTDSLNALLRNLDIPATVLPDILEPSFKTLPLQKDAMLLQRQVFVNGVGKRIKNQADVLRKIVGIPENQFKTIDTSSDTVPSAPQKVAVQPAVPESVHSDKPQMPTPPEKRKSVVRQSKRPSPPKTPQPAPVLPRTVTPKEHPGQSVPRIYCLAGQKTYSLDRSTIVAVAGYNDAQPLPDFLDPISCWVAVDQIPVPAVNLTTLLGMEAQSTENGKVVVVSGTGGMLCGLVVDAIITGTSDASPETLDLHALLAGVFPQPDATDTGTLACLLGRAGDQLYGISTNLIESILAPGQATLSRDHITVSDNSIPVFELGSTGNGTLTNERARSRTVRRDRYIVTHRDETRVAFHLDDVLGMTTVGSRVGFMTGKTNDAEPCLNGLGQNIPGGETVIVCA